MYVKLALINFTKHHHAREAGAREVRDGGMEDEDSCCEKKGGGELVESPFSQISRGLFCGVEDQ